MAAPRLASGTAGRALKSTRRSSALSSRHVVDGARGKMRARTRGAVCDGVVFLEVLGHAGGGKRAPDDLSRPFAANLAGVAPLVIVRPVQHPGSPRCDLVPLFVTRSHSTETVSIKSETASSRSRRSCRRKTISRMLTLPTPEVIPACDLSLRGVVHTPRVHRATPYIYVHSSRSVSVDATSIARVPDAPRAVPPSDLTSLTP